MVWSYAAQGLCTHAARQYFVIIAVVGVAVRGDRAATAAAASTPAVKGLQSFLAAMLYPASAAAAAAIETSATSHPLQFICILSLINQLAVHTTQPSATAQPTTQQ